jgi:hypothetical protein
MVNWAVGHTLRREEAVQQNGLVRCGRVVGVMGRGEKEVEPKDWEELEVMEKKTDKDERMQPMQERKEKDMANARRMRRRMEVGRMLEIKTERR